MYKLIRPLLFKLFKDPETAHNLALGFLRLAGISPVKNLLTFIFSFKNPILTQKVFGLEFKNPVGLAGGFDKEGNALKGLETLGFGFLEVGTITKNPQIGNPRPRLFRLQKDFAIINRMGFNNKGADALATKLTLLHSCIKVPVGVSIGKSKITELVNAKDDYLYSFKKLYEHGDYFVVNVSSPNTPGLRELTDKKFLIEIISNLQKYRSELNLKKPILVKIVVDFSFEAVDEILEICVSLGVDGIITSNTSVSREGLLTLTNETGGLSGKPISKKSTSLIRYIYKKNPNLSIIGVGGIFTAKDAYEKIKAGASLVQIYTGLIYQGPFIIKKINQELVELIEKDGFKNISEAVGVESR